MTTDEEAIKALSSLKDSGSGRTLLDLGWLELIKIDPPRAIVRLSLPGFANSQRDGLAQAAKSLLEKFSDIQTVQIEIGTPSAETSHEKQIQSLQNVPGIKHVIAVSSGKGGVGKSTVAVNLACALAKKGHKVGLMDADIYGPNTPSMLGVSDRTPEVKGNAENQKIIPIETYGVGMVSMGFLIEENQPVIWRGPMLNGIIRQFLYQASWGERDFLVVDLPPGTGDAQLSLAQAVPMSGVLIVTTPQKVSLQDSRRGLAMFKQMNIPILGVIENMSIFITPDKPERKYELFGRGGGKQLADENSVPLLAKIPLEINVLEGGNKGQPIVNTHPDSASAKAFDHLANCIVQNFAE